MVHGCGRDDVGQGRITTEGMYRMQSLTPIETRYKGYRFRSRLEARWAVFFDTLGVQWEYEKEGYDLGEAGWYLPDFWLPKYHLFVEVKGGKISEGDQAKLDAFGARHYVVVIGDIPDPGKKPPYEQNARGVDIPIDFDVEGSHLFSQELGVVGFGSTTFLCCPICKCDYVHIRSGELVEFDQTGMVMHCYGECPHKWTIVFEGSHGNVVVRVTDVIEIYQNTSFFLAEGNIARWESAITAARSARFEHGEQP